MWCNNIKKNQIKIIAWIWIFIIWSFFVYSTKIVSWFGIQQVLGITTSTNTIATVVWTNELSTNLVKNHIRIWVNAIDVDMDNSSLLWIIKNLKYLLMLDVVQEMDMSNDKAGFLDKYLNDIYQILYTSNLSISALNSQISIYSVKMETYAAQKKDSDQNFFYSLETTDDTQMRNAVQKSVENERQIWENRVQVNARKTLSNIIAYYNKLLQKKYDYIYPKKSLIVKNFDLMKDSLLEELFWTREALLKNYE